MNAKPATRKNKEIIAEHPHQTENTEFPRMLYVFSWLHFSIPDVDFSRHPAHLAQSAAKGHQGIVGYSSLDAVGQSHMSPQGRCASWQTSQAAVFSILISRVAGQCKWTDASEGADKQVTEAGAQARAPLSCLDVCPIAACTWLMGDRWVWHFWITGSAPWF